MTRILHTNLVCFVAANIFYVSWILLVVSFETVNHYHPIGNTITHRLTWMYFIGTLALVSYYAMCIVNGFISVPIMSRFTANNIGNYMSQLKKQTISITLFGWVDGERVEQEVSYGSCINHTMKVKFKFNSEIRFHLVNCGEQVNIIDQELLDGYNDQMKIITTRKRPTEKYFGTMESFYPPFKRNGFVKIDIEQPKSGSDVFVHNMNVKISNHHPLMIITNNEWLTNIMTNLFFTSFFTWVVPLGGLIVLYWMRYGKLSTMHNCKDITSKTKYELYSLPKHTKFVKPQKYIHLMSENRSYCDVVVNCVD